jgi:hypothetical protein
MELVRAILIRVSKEEEGWDVEAFDEHAEEQVVYHVQIMSEAGLLSIIDTSTFAQRSYVNIRMTWAGNDFLDAALESKRWKQARTMIEKLGGATLPVWTAVLEKLALSALDLG